MTKKLNALFKNGDKDSVQSGKTPQINIANRKINYARNRIKKICESLLTPSKSYKPEITVESIENYIQSENGIERPLYSQISNYVYSFDDAQRGIFFTNVDKLVNYAMEDNNNVEKNCKEMIIKIYDHFQLVLSKIENINKIFVNGIEETKDNLSKETKRMEKEYVAILGIFAAIVLAFVGGLTFSSSVLQNINNVSIYRIILVAAVIGLVLINILYGLFYYIDRLVRVKSEPKIRPLFITNGIILILIISVLFSWYFGFVEHRNRNLYETRLNIIPNFITEMITDGVN